MDRHMRGHCISAVVISVALAACGGGAVADGTGGAGAGGHPASGGAATGGAGSDGGAGSGGVGGGAESGGASSGGSSSGGDSAAGGGGSGGSSQGSGGASPACGCEAPSVLVCGEDGRTYDAGCGEECVPVVIACAGECPCTAPAECDCEIEGYDACYDDEQVRWVCGGSDHSIENALEQGCEVLPTGLERYCCPPSVTASVFCPP